VVLQIDQRGSVPLLTAEEVFVNAQHLGARSARQLRDPLPDKRLIPALDRGAADPVRARELTLAHAPIVGLEDFQPIRLGGPAPGSNPGKAVAKIPIALGAVVLGHSQVQHHQLVALARVLERSLVRGFNPYRLLLAVDAGRALGGPSPDMNLPATLDPFNHDISNS